MKKALYLVVTVIALGLPAQLEAYSITINNAGFESPATGFVDANTPTGWTEGGTGGTGVWNLNVVTPYWNEPAPEGSQVAFLSDNVSGPGSGSSSTLTQLVGSVAANTIYTLSGQVGHPVPFPTVYTAALLAGTSTAAMVAGLGPQGSFAPFTVVFDSSIFPFYVGQPLSIQLGSFTAQTAFDDLFLQAEGIPDGGLTALLLGLGLTGLGWMRRRV